MSKLFTLLILLFVTVDLNSQSITNVKAVRSGNDIVITYKLNGYEKNYVSLYYTNDNGKIWIGPLRSVTGDVGAGITSGTKSILWKVFNDQEELIGDSILFRVQAGQKYGTIVDIRDGKTYKTVLIGNQIWMAENLNFITNKGSICYDNTSANCARYGRLYNWETAKSVCPEGWHLPAESEWKMLIDFLGKNNIAGGKMKSETGWIGSKANTPNENGFTALPGGYRSINGLSSKSGYEGYWWSATEINTLRALQVTITSVDPSIYVTEGDKRSSTSVRCLKD